MSSISAVIEDDQFLFDLYGGLPSFEKINLHQVLLNWDGPSANLIFDLDCFPPNPPKKWNKFNIAQIELSLFPLLKVNLKRFSSGNICSLLIEKRDDVIIMNIRGRSHAVFVASSIRVVGVSAYLNLP